MDVNNFYKQRISQFLKQETDCCKKEKKFPFYRLFTIAVGITLCYLFFQINIFISVFILILFSILFILIVKKDNQNSAKKNKAQILKKLNVNELDYLNGKYNYDDEGNRYNNGSHPYSNDLDIFGNLSLYHYINRTNLFISSDILADWLRSPADVQEIKDRNEAVLELSKVVDWRQQIFILGCSLKKSDKSVTNLIKWVKKTDNAPIQKKHILICSVLSVMTFCSIIFSSFFATPYIPILFLIIHFIVIQMSSHIAKYAHNDVTNHSNILQAYADILNEIETKSFLSIKLNKLKEQLKSKNSLASDEIKKLSKIVSNFDLRCNVLVHFFINTLFFWDIRQVYKLEKWKHKNIEIAHWFQSVGEIEALSSFANLHYNNPHWCFPKIHENHFTLEATNLGHPLIQSKIRVCNNLTINGTGKILLLSGSNMSGKSTFLRAVGVNQILAMAGSCVCATDFIFSPAQIFSSMRISDSLKDNTSTFFAELKKLESIIKVVERKEKVFLLLDEILRGTNSIDRHIGSTALIKQLILNEAVGIVATHDLELAKMSHEFPNNIENYNFNIKINNDDLYFDYKLNNGVCTSLNASILMKKIGIKM